MTPLEQRIDLVRDLIDPDWSDERARAALSGVGVRRRSRRVQRAALGALLLVLALGAWLRLRPDSSLVRFADGSTAQLLDVDSVVRPAAAEAGVMVARLEAGRARFDVVHNPARRFRVESAEVVVEVLGTRFTVEKRGARTHVEVERGHVRVAFLGGTADLTAGQGGDYPPEDPVGAWLRAADQARTRGRPADALAPLQRIVDEQAADPRAPLAAFTLGRLYLDELHRPREAAAAFARVLELAPAGPLAADARARLQQAKGRP